MKIVLTCIVALTLSSGAWAHGRCSQGTGQRQRQGQAQDQGHCKRGSGQQQGQSRHCSNCAKAPTANSSAQQGTPAK